SVVRGPRQQDRSIKRALRHHDYGMELDPIPHQNHHLALFVVVITGRRREAVQNIRLLPPRANRQQEKQNKSSPLHLPLSTDQPVAGFGFQRPNLEMLWPQFPPYP